MPLRNGGPRLALTILGDQSVVQRRGVELVFHGSAVEARPRLPNGERPRRLVQRRVASARLDGSQVCHDSRKVRSARRCARPIDPFAALELRRDGLGSN